MINILRCIANSLPLVERLQFGNVFRVEQEVEDVSILLQPFRAVRLGNNDNSLLSQEPVADL